MLNYRREGKVYGTKPNFNQISNNLKKYNPALP